MNELANIVVPKNLLEVFTTGNGLDPVLNDIRTKIDDFNKTIRDMDIKEHRDEVRTFAMWVVKSKTTLEKERKKLAEEQKKIPTLIDAEGKRVKRKLEEWQAEARQQLTDWEIADKARKDAILQRVNDIADLVKNSDGQSADFIYEQRKIADAIIINDSFDESKGYAEIVLKETLVKLQCLHTAREIYEGEQAQLQSFRDDEVKRKQKERDEKLRKEAADKATKAVEDKAKNEKEAIEQKATVEREAADQREADLKAEVEQAEFEKKEAEDRAAMAEERAKQKVIDEKEAEAEAQRERESNRRHKGIVNSKVVGGLIASGLVDLETAKGLVKWIANKKIEDLTINY